ncbi:hypothetical protein EYF80_067480 [Liparis tanakae]|uniref:Uncharacterized protein n=1 Tax=Liparis tanakae TaxID=230148 RepID=A0A4Z2E0Q9_9TELE|nr:hypothetical protein EYF80_067480 [Liparis tanakae]
MRTEREGEREGGLNGTLSDSEEQGEREREERERLLGRSVDVSSCQQQVPQPADRHCSHYSSERRQSESNGDALREGYPAGGGVEG